MSIKKHESGKKHQEMVMEFKKEKRELKVGAARDEADLARQMREIEKAAALAVEQDLATGNVKYSSAVSGSSFSSRKGVPPPPSRAPPPPRAEPNQWSCGACGKDNIQTKLQCIRCAASRPSEGGEGEDDDDGIYKVGDVTYMDGKKHEHKLKRNCFAQMWLENIEEWVDCVIMSVQSVAVAHTDVTLRSLSAAYYPDTKIVPPSALKSVEDFLAGGQHGSPCVVTAVPPDKFRVILDGTEQVLPEHSAQDEVPCDEATGFGGWQTVSVVEVTEVDEEAKKERERIYLEKVAARKEAEAQKERERRDQEDYLNADGDDAMSSYDPWQKGVYKGIVLDPQAKQSSKSSALPPPPPPSSRIPLPPPPPPPSSSSSSSSGGWGLVEEPEKKRKLEVESKHASSLAVSVGAAQPAVFKKTSKTKKKFRSKQEERE